MTFTGMAWSQALLKGRVFVHALCTHLKKKKGNIFWSVSHTHRRILILVYSAWHRQLCLSKWSPDTLMDKLAVLLRTAARNREKRLMCIKRAVFLPPIPSDTRPEIEKGTT